MRTRLFVILLYILAVPSVEAEATKGGFLKLPMPSGSSTLRQAARIQMPARQSFSCGRLQKRALASIFPGSHAHLSPKDTTERTFRSVSNG